MGKAFFLCGEVQYQREWEDAPGNEAPGTMDYDGAVELLSNDHVISYPLHAKNQPAFKSGEIEIWAWNGMKHRTDGPATDYWPSLPGGKRFWVFGIEVSEEELRQHRASFEAIERFLEARKISVSEFSARDEWCRFENKQDLIEAAVSGKINLVSGPRDQQIVKSTSFTEAANSGMSVLAAAGAIGVLGVLAKAKAVAVERKQKLQEERA